MNTKEKLRSLSLSSLWYILVSENHRLAGLVYMNVPCEAYRHHLTWLLHVWIQVFFSCHFEPPKRQQFKNEISMIVYWLLHCCPWRGGWAAVSGAPSSRSAGWTWCGPFLASGLLPTEEHTVVLALAMKRLSDRMWRLLLQQKQGGRPTGLKIQDTHCGRHNVWLMM